MKKLFIMTLTGMMFVNMSLNAQQDTKSFVKQYQKQDGFTTVTIGKPIVRMLSLFAKFEDEEVSQIFKHMNAIQILAFERGSNKNRCETFNNEMLVFCNANGYEELVEVVKHDDTVKIFCKTEGDAITGLIILNRSNQGSSAAMVCINGKFTFEDVQSITGNVGKTGKNIAGL